MVSSLVRRLLNVGALWLLVVGGAQAQGAQTPLPPVCQGALAQAEQLYADQVYSAVAPLALDCIYGEDLPPAEMRHAHRLLALSYLKQGLLPEARLTIVRLLGIDYSYEPDPRVDIPTYVALVNAVRDQLRVAETSSPSDPPRPEAPVAESPRLEPSETETPTRETSTPGASTPELAPQGAVSPVDINAAGVEVLDEVPGIGPVLASRIVAHREQHGAFRSVSDLVNVRGIGVRSLERIRPHLVAGPTMAPIGNAPARQVAEVPSASPGGPVSSGGRLVNLNTATAEELDTLPGIGPALAQRIIEFRTEYGPFKNIEEVTLVRGIGPRTLEDFADQVTVE